MSHNGLNHNGVSPQTLLRQIVNVDGASSGFVQDSEVSTFARTYLDDTSGRAVAATLGVPYILAASAAASLSHTGDTSKTALATVAVPANAMGANGVLRVTSQWTVTNSANNKTVSIDFGGSTFMAFVTTTNATIRHGVQIHNRNATNSQVSSPAASPGFGAQTAAVFTAAVDTTSAQNLVLSATLANSGETITLESYLVELLYGA